MEIKFDGIARLFHKRSSENKNTGRKPIETVALIANPQLGKEKEKSELQKTIEEKGVRLPPSLSHQKLDKGVVYVLPFPVFSNVPTNDDNPEGRFLISASPDYRRVWFQDFVAPGKKQRTVIAEENSVAEGYITINGSRRNLTIEDLTIFRRQFDLSKFDSQATQGLAKI